MNFTRRQVLRIGAGPLLAATLPAATLPIGVARAQPGDWPSRPIRLIVPYLAGTAPDSSARTIAAAMGPLLKASIVVENKPGAAGNLGAQLAAHAPADGYTWVYAASPMASAMKMYRKPGFDVLKDFAMVGRMSISDLVVIAPPDSGMRSMADLLERARKRPGELNWASGGVGSPAHMGGELMLSVAGVTANHVPFKGASESLNAVMGKQVDFALTVTSVALAQWKQRKVAVLGITGPRRNPVLPDVPTLVEQGLAGVELVSFGGLAVPAGTPEPIVRRISQAMREAIAQPDVRAFIEAQAGVPAPSTPEGLADAMRAEMVQTERMMKAAKIDVQ